jgi:plastocyanin
MRMILGGALVSLLMLSAGCDDDSSAGMDSSVMSDQGVPEDLAQLPQGDLAPTMTASVDVIDNAYVPSTINLLVGGTVTWTWKGAAPHTVTSDDGTSFDSQPAKTRGMFSHTFTAVSDPKTGIKYHCRVHGTAMSGAIFVTAP